MPLQIKLRSRVALPAPAAALLPGAPQPLAGPPSTKVPEEKQGGKGEGVSRQQVWKGSTTRQNNPEAQQAITHFGGEKEAPQLTAAKPTDGAARWMWNLRGRALEPEQIRSCMGGGAQQDANSETLAAAGRASGEDSRTGASRAEQGPASPQGHTVMAVSSPFPPWCPGSCPTPGRGEELLTSPWGQGTLRGGRQGEETPRLGTRLLGELQGSPGLLRHHPTRLCPAGM